MKTIKNYISIFPVNVDYNILIIANVAFYLPGITLPASFPRMARSCSVATVPTLIPNLCFWRGASQLVIRITS